MLEIFKQLHGAWTFERTINNYLTPACSGFVNGKANFALINQHEYLFTESGEFVTDNNKIPVQNEYIYAFDPTAQTIIVYSSQEQTILNKLFTLNFAPQANKLLSAASEHQCAADHYTAQYIIEPDDSTFSLQIILAVRGPNKNYQSVTNFQLQQS